MTDHPTPVSVGGESLLPCPFCGAKAGLVAVRRDWWRIECEHDEECVFDPDEGMTVPQTEEQKAMLVRDWNRRALPPPPQGEGKQHAFVGQEVITPEGAAIKVTRLHLSPAAREALRSDSEGIGGGDEGMVRPDKAHLIAIFKRALAGSDKDVGLWRGIRAVIDAYEAGEVAAADEGMVRDAAEALRDVVDRNWGYIGQDADASNPNSGYNRVKRGRAMLEKLDAMLAASPVDGRKQP